MLKIEKAGFYLVIFFMVLPFLIFVFYKAFHEQVYESYSEWKVEKNTAYTLGEISELPQEISIRSSRFVYYLIICYNVNGNFYIHKIRNPKSQSITSETKSLYKFKVAYCKDDPKWSVIILPDSLKSD